MVLSHFNHSDITYQFKSKLKTIGCKEFQFYQCLNIQSGLKLIIVQSHTTPEIAFFYTKQGHNLRNIEEIKSLLNLKFQTFKKTQVLT